MTSSAATSRTHSEPAIDAVRSATTTGAPVTVYVAPLVGFHSFIATAARICRSAAVRRASLRPAFSRTWMSAAVPGPPDLEGNR